MKRAFAVLLAVLMIIALVGCGKAQREVIKLPFPPKTLKPYSPPPESCFRTLRLLPAQAAL